MSSNGTPGVKTSVQQTFNQAAPNYTTSPIHASGPDLAEMVRLAALTGQETVLDAGTGTGHTALYFAPHVATVTAIDLTAQMVVQGEKLAATRGITNVEFRQADVERLPFADASFDLITTRYSAHHWPNLSTALQEFRRLLRPGGRVLVSDIVTWEDPTLDTHFQAIELLRDPSHVRDHSPSQWLTLLQQAGFAAEVAHRWEVYIDFASWIKRVNTPEPAAAMIRTLLANAPQEVKDALQAQPDGSFTMQAAIFLAR